MNRLQRWREQNRVRRIALRDADTDTLIRLAMIHGGIVGVTLLAFLWSFWAGMIASVPFYLLLRRLTDRELRM